MSTTHNNNNNNPLYTSIPIIQRVMSFTPCKKLSTPIKLAQVTSSWEETCKVYGGASLPWLHEAEKKTTKSVEKLVSFFHKACSANGDVAVWIVKQLLQLGIVDPLATDRAGFQAIHFASRYGNMKTLDILLFHHLLYPLAFYNRQKELFGEAFENTTTAANQTVAMATATSSKRKSMAQRRAAAAAQSATTANDELKKEYEEDLKRNPKRIVSLYATTKKSDHTTIIDIAAETGQSELIKHLIENRNFNPAANISSSSLTSKNNNNQEVKNALWSLLSGRGSGLRSEKYYKEALLSFRKMWNEYNNKDGQNNTKDENNNNPNGDPRYSMKSVVEIQLEQREQEEEEKRRRNEQQQNGNDDDDDDDAGYFSFFTRSASSMGYIETNNDDKELQIILDKHYNRFASIKSLKKNAVTNDTNETDKSEKRNLLQDGDIFSKLFSCRLSDGLNFLLETPLQCAVRHSRFEIIRFFLDEFPNSSCFRGDALLEQDPANRSSSIFFSLVGKGVFSFTAQRNYATKSMTLDSFDASITSSIGKILVDVMERSNAELFERKKKAIQSEKKDEDDRATIIRLEKDETIVERRRIPGDLSTPTPFLSVAEHSSVGRSQVGMFQFLIFVCGANPLAVEICPVTSSEEQDDAHGSGDNDDDTDGDEKTNNSTNENEEKSTKDSFYIQNNALSKSLNSFSRYAPQSDFLETVKFLVSVGVDPYQKCGQEKWDLFERMKHRISSQTTQSVTGTRREMMPDNLKTMMERLKEAVDSGLEIYNSSSKSKK